MTVADARSGRYGGEAEIARRERAALAFRLGRTNNEPGEQHARDRSCCTLYCNDGFAAYRRRRKASLPGSRGRDGGRQQKLVRVLSQARRRELQLYELQSMLPNGAGARRLLPTQSVSGHGVRDRLHLVVRWSTALEPQRSVPHSVT